MNFVKELALRGEKSQPKWLGESAGFYPHMFIGDRKKWVLLVEATIRKGFDDKYECSNGYGTPIGDTFYKTADNFVYLYRVNAYGDWCAIAYTHKIIADGMHDELPSDIRKCLYYPCPPSCMD